MAQLLFVATTDVRSTPLFHIFSLLFAFILLLLLALNAEFYKKKKKKKPGYFVPDLITLHNYTIYTVSHIMVGLKDVQL